MAAVRRGSSKSNEKPTRLLAELPVPPLGGRAFVALRESIRRDGQLQPVLVDEEGTIWDGRSRFLACQQLGVDAKEQRISREQGLQAAIASTIRREMSPLEKADFVEWLERHSEQVGIKIIPNGGRVRAVLSRYLREELGWRHGTSEAQVAKLLLLAKATPAERELVKDAPTVNEALRRLRDAEVERIVPRRTDPTPAEQAFLDAASTCLANVEGLDEDICGETLVMAKALRRQLSGLVSRATAPKPPGHARPKKPQDKKEQAQ